MEDRSDKLKQSIGFFKFHFVRIGKWLVILFKKNRRLEKLTFDYYKNWHADNSYLIVDLKFKNAFYFKIGNFKSFDFEKPLILNLQKVKADNIKLEIFGFRQKQIFVIDLNKEIQLNSKPFKTTIESISSITITQQKTNIKIANLWFTESKPKVSNQNVSVNSNPIKIKSSKFKIQEYL